MTYRIKFGKQYRKDLKRLEREHVDLSPLFDVIEQLRYDKPLDERHRDHALKGILRGSRACHIKPDWVLHYEKDDEYLYLHLFTTGTHRHVFGIE